MILKYSFNYMLGAKYIRKQLFYHWFWPNTFLCGKDLSLQTLLASIAV